MNACSSTDEASTPNPDGSDGSVDSRAPEDSNTETRAPDTATSDADSSTSDTNASDTTTSDTSDAGDDLPPPTTDSAEMRLNGVRATLVSKQFCANGSLGIGFEKSAGDPLPTLFLHNVDLTATGTVLIKSGAEWHLDIDDTAGVWGTTTAGCNGTVLENTGVFDLQVLNCPIAKAFGGSETGTVSFRVRCTKAAP